MAATDSGTGSNIALGRCYGSFTPNGASEEQWGFIRNATVAFSPTVRFASVPAYGEAPVKAKKGGVACVVTVEHMENRPKILARALQNAAESTSVVTAGGKTGADAAYGVLTLVPVDGTDPIGSYTFHKVVPVLTGDIEYSEEQEGTGTRILTVEYHAMLDFGQSDGEELFATTAGGDTTAPQISSAKIKGTATDVDSATDVAITADFDVTFNEVVGPGGDWDYAITLVSEAGAIVDCSFTTAKVSASEFHVYVDPGTMDNDTVYYLAVLKTVRDLAGNHLAAGAAYSFTTVSL